ncbi:TPA: hypothetical protein ACGO1T_001053 [Streptococcus suis]
MKQTLKILTLVAFLVAVGRVNRKVNYLTKDMHTNFKNLDKYLTERLKY